MAIEYSLTLAGTTPAEEVARRALPGVVFAPHGGTIGTGADTLQRLGFDLAITGGTDGYVDAVGDDGAWVWDPNPAVVATFRLTQDPDRSEIALRGALEATARILATGAEDAALVVNWDHLLLTRLDSVMAKHARAEWWDHHGWPNEVIPG